MQITNAFVAGSVILAVLSGCAVFQTQAERGYNVADRWCSECHRIAPVEPSGMRVGHVLPPQVDAPSFMAIAARQGANRERLQYFMANLHLPMPTFRLDAREREEVIAYILSLKEQP